MQPNPRLLTLDVVGSRERYSSLQVKGTGQSPSSFREIALAFNEYRSSELRMPNSEEGNNWIKQLSSVTLESFSIATSNPDFWIDAEKAIKQLSRTMLSAGQTSEVLTKALHEVKQRLAIGPILLPKGVNSIKRLVRDDSNWNAALVQMNRVIERLRHGHPPVPTIDPDVLSLIGKPTPETEITLREIREKLPTEDHMKAFDFLTSLHIDLRKNPGITTDPTTKKLPPKENTWTPASISRTLEIQYQYATQLRDEVLERICDAFDLE